MRIEDLVRDVELLLAKDRKSEARERLKRYDSQFCDSAEYHLMVSESEFSVGDIRGALDAANKALNLSGFSAAALYQRSRIYRNIGNYNDANHDLEKVALATSDSDRIHLPARFEYALNLIPLGRADEAKQIYLELVSADWPSDTDAFYFASEMSKFGEDVEALNILECLFQQRRLENPDWLRHLAYIQKARGRAADAIKTLEHASSIAPNHVASLLDLGWLRFQSGDLIEAIRILREAVRYDPTNAHPRCSLAWILASDELDHEAAKEALHVANEMMAMEGYQEHRKLKVVARCQLRLGNIKDARETVAAAVAIAPQDEHSELRALLGGR